MSTFQISLEIMNDIVFSALKGSAAKGYWHVKEGKTSKT